MSGVIVNREGKLYIKDGEDNIPLHPDSSFDNRVGDVVNFEYVTCNDIKYGRVID